MATKRGRLHEQHYILESEDDEEDGEFVEIHSFILCTPKERLKACPICEANTAAQRAAIVRRFQVNGPRWDQWCIIDTRKEAVYLVREDIDNGFNQDKHRDYSIRPLWMLYADIEKLPEWEP